MMPSVDWNRREWGENHSWASGGDEWSDLAEYCRQPYDEWKQSLIDTFVEHLMPIGSVTVEIAPGYGRWTEHLLPRAGRLDIVDINQNCLDACVRRFPGRDALVPHLSSGSGLGFIADESVDFVWSFDSFVHMEPTVVRDYVREIARVLRPAGRAVIHHADVRALARRVHPLLSRLGRIGRVAMSTAGQGRLRDDGNRSAVAASDVAEWGSTSGLRLEAQTDSWGEDHQYTVAKCRDCITVFTK
jgi:SAM-dependent methyltransferase